MCVCPFFSFGFEGWMWDLIVLVSDHSLSFYFVLYSIFMYVCYNFTMNKILNQTGIQNCEIWA